MDHEVTVKGFLGRAILRMVLLFVVLSHVTYLASRYRLRSDLTTDQLYTLTSSTQKVLDKLEDRLVIEAYFSPKQNLPILEQPKRMALVNLLEEYEKAGFADLGLRDSSATDDDNVRAIGEMRDRMIAALRLKLAR